MILPVGFGSSAGGTPANAISRSLRFNSADTPYLNRTPASAGNRKTWTWSGWIKRSSTSQTYEGIFQAGTASSAQGLAIGDTSTANIIAFYYTNNDLALRSTQVLRDVSAWYHLVVALDTTQATASNRLRIYLNGSEITTWTTDNRATAFSQNSDQSINNNIQHIIGNYSGVISSIYSLNGYMTEINFIDGLTPNTTTRTVSGVTQTILTELGQFNTNTGVWEPAAWTRAFGTNGFYVNFSDNSNTTAATLGKDYSGNGNNWTPNNFSVTAGAGNDSMVDSPTSYGTDTGVGGEVRGNYATLNSLKRFTANVTLSNGNLTASDGSTTSTSAIATINLPTSGKWYWEVTVSASVASGIFIGACPEANAYGTAVVQTNGSYRNNGTIYNTASATQTSGATYTTNDVIGVAVDVDNGTVQFYKNGVAQGATPSFSFTALSVLVPFIATDNASGTKTVNCNFGQTSFLKWNGSAFVANTAPSGFKALCTQNLDTPVIGATSSTQANKYFNTILYNGNGNTGQTVTGVGFQPDWVWLKNRNTAGGYFHCLFDAVRGAGLRIRSDSTAAEVNASAIFSAFTSDGFTFPAGQGNTIENDGSPVGNYVAWNWKANGAGSTNSNGTAKSSAVTVDSSTDTVTWNSHGMSDGQKIGFFASVIPGGLSAGTLYFVRDASTNTFKVAATSGGAAIDITSNGTSVTCHTTLTSTVSANTTSEFSIVTYTGTGANTTVEHGLDIAPTFIITKRRNGVVGWPCLVKAANSGNGQNGRLNLDETAAYANNVEFWNNTSPTSKVFSIGTSVGTNASGATMVAYCFAPVASYSAFGSYESNNSTDGPFIYTGFRPEYIMFKRSSTGANGWAIFDAARNTFNATNNNLLANSTGTENSVVGAQPIDFTANGIKIRTSWSDVNGTGTYIYMAFAESPFKYALAR
jgi:hypothetical protein